MSETEKVIHFPSSQTIEGKVEKIISDASERTGNNVRLVSLYKTYFKKLASNLRSVYGAGPPDPEDVAQRAFENLNKQPNYDEIRDPEGYVWICARNIVMSEMRAQQVSLKNREEIKMRCFSPEGDTFDPERVLMAKEQLAIVMDTLNRMSPRRRQIFILNRMHGLTPKEAGLRCDVSRTAAVRHIAEATAAIAKALAESSDINVDESTAS